MLEERTRLNKDGFGFGVCMYRCRYMRSVEEVKGGERERQAVKRTM